MFQILRVVCRKIENAGAPEGQFPLEEWPNSTGFSGHSILTHIDTSPTAVFFQEWDWRRIAHLMPLDREWAGEWKLFFFARFHIMMRHDASWCKCFKLVGPSKQIRYSQWSMFFNVRSSLRRALTYWYSSPCFGLPWAKFKKIFQVGVEPVALAVLSQLIEVLDTLVPKANESHENSLVLGHDGSMGGEAKPPYTVAGTVIGQFFFGGGW